MPAPAPCEVFSYTARRSDYLSLVIAFAMLVILEAVGMDLLAAILIQGWLKFVLLALIVSLHNRE